MSSGRVSANEAGETPKRFHEALAQIVTASGETIGNELDGPGRLPISSSVAQDRGGTGESPDNAASGPASHGTEENRGAGMDLDALETPGRLSKLALLVAFHDS